VETITKQVLVEDGKWVSTASEGTGWSHAPFNQETWQPPVYREETEEITVTEEKHSPDIVGLDEIAKYLPNELEPLVLNQLQGESLSAFSRVLRSRD
jgi:hypothetical protein